MTEHEQNLERRLTSAASVWQRDVPPSVVDAERLVPVRRSLRAGLIAAAAVLVAIAGPVGYVALHSSKQPDAKPVGKVETPAENLPLTPHEVDVALTVAKQRQASVVRGTFVGAVVAPVVLTEPIMNDDCPLTRLLRIRLVWESDASFDHGSLATGPGATPDGPLKSFLLFVDPADGQVCSHGAVYRAVGARDEEALLYGARPQDPTGEFDASYSRGERSDFVQIATTDGHVGFADRTVYAAVTGQYLRTADQARDWQQLQSSMTWKTLRISVYRADGEKIGDQEISRTREVAPQDAEFVSYPTEGKVVLDALNTGRLEVHDGCLGLGQGSAFHAAAFPDRATFDGRALTFDRDWPGSPKFELGSWAAFGGGSFSADMLKNLNVPAACAPYAKDEIALLQLERP